MNTGNNSTCFGDADSNHSNHNKSTRFGLLLSELQPTVEEDQDHQLFTIELIVDLILEELNHKERLECRQVNSSLNYIATHYLQHPKRSQSFHFQYDSTIEKYLLSTSTTKKTLGTFNFSLEALSSVLSTSWNFPVRSFTFSYGKLNVSSLQNFLSIYGEKIRKLKIQVFYSLENIEDPTDYPPISMFKKLLNTQVPFLESLILTHFPTRWPYKVRNRFGELLEDSDTNLKILPNLKCLELGGWNEYPVFIERILKAAPNLEKVKTNHSRIVVAAKKFHLLRNYCFSREVLKSIYDIGDDLMSCRKSHLEGICISLGSTLKIIMERPQIAQRAGQALQKILETNAQTLTRCIFLSPLNITPLNVHLKIPRLPKVTLVTIMTPYPEPDEPLKSATAQSELSHQYFPLGFQFHKKFPNLNKVIFNMDNLNESVLWEKHFMLYEPVTTVKTLLFTESKYIPFDTMWFCHQIFPELNYLEIHTKYFDFYSAAVSGLFEFSHLKELRFDVHLDTSNNFGRNTFPFLDAGLTGFGPDGVLFLFNYYSQPNVEFDAIDTEAHDYYSAFAIEQYSILNLKELEKLIVTFVDQSIEAKHYYPLILSEVARMFALAKCPNLQMSAGFNVRNDVNVERIKDAVYLNFPV